MSTPDVCDMRCQILRSISPWLSSSLSLMFLNSGRYFDTLSWMLSLPCSSRIFISRAL